MENRGGGTILKVAVTELDTLPLVAVTLTFHVPAGVPGGTEKVRAAKAALSEKRVNVVTLRLHDGQFEAGQRGGSVVERSTGPVNPPVPNNTIIESLREPITVSEEPSNVWKDGEAVMEKAGANGPPKLAVCSVT